MEKKEYVLATTSTDGFTYEEYKFFCEDHEIEPGEENSGEFYEWCTEEACINWKDDLENIKHCKEYNVPVVITGTLGLWDGRHKISPVRVDSVYQAVQLCMDGRSIEDVDVKWVDGVIMVYAHHHDGTNIFEVSALNKKGVAKKYASYKPHDVKRLPYLYNL